MGSNSEGKESSTTTGNTFAKSNNNSSKNNNIRSRFGSSSSSHSAAASCSVGNFNKGKDSKKNRKKAAGSYVTLTLRPPQQTPAELIVVSPGIMPSIGLIPGVGGNVRQSHLNMQIQSPNERVTAPLPANKDVQMQMLQTRLLTLQAMRDEAAADVEKKWKKCEISQNPNDQKDLEKAQQRLKKIESQMKSFRQCSPNLQLQSPAPFNPYPQSHHSVAFHPYSGGQQHTSSFHFNQNHHKTKIKNRNPLSAQAQVSYMSQRSWDHPQGDIPPPLPPRSYSHSQSFSSNDQDSIRYSHRHNNHSGHHQKNYHPNNNDVHEHGRHRSNTSPIQHQQHVQQTHHRAKSSPDPISMQKALNAEARRSDSINDLTISKVDGNMQSSSSNWAFLSSPPGSPPPPYGNENSNEENHTYNNFALAKALFRPISSRPTSHMSPNNDIMSMEEDDGIFDLNKSPGKGPGPYSSFSKLLGYNAHLAVFLNYVIDNRCDPSSLIFYLITSLSITEASTKDTKKWAYEIHSTFTAPESPLLVPNVDVKISEEIDIFLSKESKEIEKPDKEILKRVFLKARFRAKEEINKQLEEFCNKRTAGLGSMFGPPDSQLEESLHNKNIEMRIVETYLLPRLEFFIEEYDKNQDERTFAIINSVATVLLKQFNIRQTNTIQEKCQTYISKDKRGKKFFIKSKQGKRTICEHNFDNHTYYSYTLCTLCSKILWGISPQGLKCAACNMNIHQHCVNKVQDVCLGKPKKFKFQIPGGENTKPRPDTVSEEQLPIQSGEEEEFDKNNPEASKPVGRSESCKETTTGNIKKTKDNKRKNSDPYLHKSETDLENRHLSEIVTANSGSSSSNSSISTRSASPSSLNNDRNCSENETVGHSATVNYSSGWLDADSDIEIEDTPDWTKSVNEETLAGLNRLEKKRQEVLNELFHTERSHVRNLKIVDRLFYRPIVHQQLLSQEIIHMLFPNLEEMLEIHEHFNETFKKKRKEIPLIGEIGDVLLELFDGEVGGNFKRAASQFCAKQQIGLEYLKERKKKDQKFSSFLEEVERDPICRRLELKDMIPMPMFRLTKYPLLFETLSNCTPQKESQEYKNIQRAVELSKEILNCVNKGKKEAEDSLRIEYIQRKLERPAFEKGMDKSDVHELRNLDLTRHKLIYEGSLSWRTLKPKGQKPECIDVQALLLKDMIVLLIRQDDRFILKAHSINVSGERFIVRPIIKLANLIHREVATDKKAFFLMNTTSANMYELVCTTHEERKVWLHHISKAAEDFNKSRQQKQEILPNANIPSGSGSDQPDDRNKEVPVEVEGNNNVEAEPGSGIGEQSKEDKNASPPLSDLNEATNTPEKSGNGDSDQNMKQSALRKQPCDFLRMTVVEDSSLIDLDQIKINQPPEIQVAISVISQHGLPHLSALQPAAAPSFSLPTTELSEKENGNGATKELKRVDSSITKAFEEKLKIMSNILNIPSETVAEPSSSPSSSSKVTITTTPALFENPKDAKELVLACMYQVDELSKILSEQKISSDNLPQQREQTTIHKSLNNLLLSLLSEVQRRDDERLERRQELHRLREQNHGYQERLQAKINKLHERDSLGSLGSPTLSPSHSRPNSFLSASSSSDHHHHDDEIEVVMISKHQSESPVVSSVYSPENSIVVESPSQLGRSTYEISDFQRSDSANALASDLAQDEFADALEDLSSPIVEAIGPIILQEYLADKVPEKLDSSIHEEKEQTLEETKIKVETPEKEKTKANGHSRDIIEEIEKPSNFSQENGKNVFEEVEAKPKLEDVAE